MIIGIDLGKLGGICIQEDNSFTTMVMPETYVELSNLIKEFSRKKFSLDKLEFEGCLVVFEELHGIFSASKSSTWSLAEQSGALIGICTALGLPFKAVPPKEWQQEMFQGLPPIRKATGSTDTKAMALVACKRLFPDVKVLMTSRSKVPHNGVVDAVLLSEYGRRKF